MTYDVFISYRHARKDEVLALYRQLEQAGIRCFRDEERRDDDASIQRTIEQGLANSRLLLAWYDPSYLQSRACAWEFSRALLAAHASGDGLERIVCVDPSRSFSHIVPEALLDQARSLDPGDAASLPRLLQERLQRFPQPLGQVVAGDGADWHERDRPSHPTWVGRADELIRLFHELDRGRLAMHGGQRAAVAITGYGGEGKTMLAEQYALRFASAYPGGIVWLSGATQDGVNPRPGQWQDQLESALTAAAAGKLGLPVAELVMGQTDSVQRIRILKAGIDKALQERARDSTAPAIAPYLWIIDDLPDRLAAQEQQLWLPPTDQAHCLATLREGGGVAATFNRLAVTTLPRHEALEMLGSRQPPADEIECGIAARIVESVGHLPLALALGATVVETLGYRGYLDMLESASSAELDELVEALGPALPTGHAHSVVGTFLRSLEQLPDEQAATATDAHRATWLLLRMAALMEPLPLPDGLAESVLRLAGFGDKAAMQLKLATATLHRAGLVRRDGQAVDARSSIHALMARTVREARMTDEVCDEVLDWLIAATGEWIDAQLEKPPVENDLLATEATLHLCARRTTAQAATLACSAWHLAYRAGLYALASDLCQPWLAICMAIHGPDDPETWKVTTALAITAHEQGDLVGARLLKEQVLDNYRHGLGEDHPDTWTAMNNLAHTMKDQGDLASALSLQRQVLDKRRHGLGENHPDTLGAMNNLAGSLWLQGDLAGARELQKQVLDKRRQELGDDHRDTWTAMNNLAAILADQGDYAGARTLQEQVLDKRLQWLGPNHSDTWTAMNNLATTFWDLGDLSSARTLQEQVLDKRRHGLGDDHADTWSAMSNLANTLWAQGDHAEAQALLKQVLDRRLHGLGEDHPDTWTTRNDLACELWEQGDYAGARVLQEQVLAWRHHRLGAQHPDTDSASWNLYRTLLSLGNLSEIRQFEQEKVQEWEAKGAEKQGLYDFLDKQRAAHGLPAASADRPDQ